MTFVSVIFDKLEICTIITLTRWTRLQAIIC